VVAQAATVDPSSVPTNDVGTNFGAVIPVGQGWTLAQQKLLVQVNPNQAMAIEAVDMQDVDFLGLFNIGSVPPSMTQLQAQYKQAGSNLYSYAVYKNPSWSILGVTATTYRLITLHSLAMVLFLVALLALAVVWGLAVHYHWTGVVDVFGNSANGLKQMCNGVPWCNPTASAKSLYLWVAGIGLIATFGVWALSSTLSKHEGFGPERPPSAPGIVLPTMTTGYSTGFDAGPFHSGQTTGVGGGQPAPSGGGGFATSPPPARAPRAAKRAARGHSRERWARSPLPTPIPRARLAA
jgi:hypothetical protein